MQPRRVCGEDEPLSMMMLPQYVECWNWSCTTNQHTHDRPAEWLIGSSSWSWRWERGAWLFAVFQEFWGALCKFDQGVVFYPGSFLLHIQIEILSCVFLMRLLHINTSESFLVFAVFLFYPTSESHSFLDASWFQVEIGYFTILIDYAILCTYARTKDICTWILEVAHMTHISYTNIPLTNTSEFAFQLPHGSFPKTLPGGVSRAAPLGSGESRGVAVPQWCCRLLDVRL